MKTDTIFRTGKGEWDWGERFEDLTITAIFFFFKNSMQIGNSDKFLYKLCGVFFVARNIL